MADVARVDDVPDGIDAAAVTDWLSSRVDVVAPLSFATIAGGRSNLTFHVTDASQGHWVLRRPPLNSVLASAHDVIREHRIMSALQDGPVPVPPLVGAESEPGVLDAPFFVMHHVDALVVREPDDATDLDAGARRRAGESLVDVLVDLHAVDPDEVGLGELGRREDYLARQLHVWHRQYEHGASREVPAITGIRDRLAARVPVQQRATIVHGDYRLDNLMVDRDGEVVAVLDWELCTLGDPLADLGLLRVYWNPFDDASGLPMIPAAASIAGMPTWEEVVAGYAEGSSLDLSDLDTYVAFGYWKLAVILEGVLARMAAGAYGDPDHDLVDRFAEIVVALLDRADDASA